MRILIGLVCFFSFALPAMAEPLETVAAPAAQAMYAEGKPPAMVIAIVRGDETYIAGFGETAPGNGVTPTGRSLVRIASLSKLFSSQVLATMAADGQVKLDDALDTFAPAGAAYTPCKGCDPIRLFHLATHTSGLPRELAASLNADRWGWLAKQKKMPVPGLRALYSNLGFDFLADALSRAGGMPYTALLADIVTGPADMRDTTAAPNAEQCGRMITGGKVIAPCADQTDIAGNGGVYSTADDMAKWIGLQVGRGESVGDPARALMQTIYLNRTDLGSAVGLDHAGQADGIGLAWIFMKGANGESDLWQKTGNIGGFMSYVVIARDAPVGVFVAVARPEKAKKGDPKFRMKLVFEAANALVRQLAAAP